MSMESAQRFVVAMREDKDLRDQAKMAATNENLSDLLQKKGFVFEMRQLVAAMAGCMEDMEQG